MSIGHWPPRLKASPAPDWFTEPCDIDQRARSLGAFSSEVGTSSREETRQNKKLEPGSDSIRTGLQGALASDEMNQACGRTSCATAAAVGIARVRK